MKKPLFFNKNIEIFRWGPIPGRYFYVSEFEDAVFSEYVKLYKGKRWPKTLLLFKGKQMVWINDFSSMRAIGKHVFIKYMLPINKRKSLKKDWRIKIKDLSDFENKINEKLLKNLSDKEFAALLNKFYNLIVSFWAPTIPAELGNYGSTRLLEEKLKKAIPDKNKLLSSMEILATPDTVSFYQQEEIDLSETNDLKKHQKKYFWIKNSYNGTETLSLDFFKKRKKELAPDIKKDIKKQLKETRDKKRKLISKYKLSKEIANTANAICEGISWQDERKKHIFIYIHYKELFLKDAARRYGYSIDRLRNCSLKEITDITNIHNIIQKRDKIFGFFVDKHKEELLGEKALLAWEEYGEEKVQKNIKKINGIIVSKGKKDTVKGIVKIIFDPKKNKKFKAGDILVAPMTSPEYVFLMKTSKAVITDAGGLTSHAAIVSRELKIPCIVGTKFATKVLKDGDKAVIDVKKGIIRKL